MSSVEEDQAAVKRFLERFGIVAELRAIESNGDGRIHDQIKDFVNDPDLDLIVVDYLMDEMNGEELISQIRSSEHVFLPVVFYSSNGVQSLAEAAAKSQLDGVYLAPRNGVRQKIELVITSLLRKEQSIKRVRGLLMEGVSEIDATFGIVFDELWNKLASSERLQVIAYFKEQLADRAKGANEAVSKFPENEDAFVEYAVKEFVTPKFDTALRWRIIKKSLKILKVDDVVQSTFHELFEPKGSLIRLRNDYAHKTRIELEKLHNDSLCVGIRKALHRHVSNLETIHSVRS